MRGFTGTGLEAATTGSGTGASTSLSMMMSSSDFSLMEGMLRLRSLISRLDPERDLHRRGAGSGDATQSKPKLKYVRN